MRSLLFLAALGLVVVLVPSPASACAEGEPCYWVNDLCEKVFGNGCIPASESTERCPGPICDLINVVCRLVIGNDCVAAPLLA